MARDPSSDIPLRGSHAPRVGAGESRAAAATRRVERARAAAAADGVGPDLLGRALEIPREPAFNCVAAKAPRSDSRGPFDSSKVGSFILVFRLVERSIRTCRRV